MKRFVKEYATFVMNQTIDSEKYNKATKVLRMYQHNLLTECSAMLALAILHQEIQAEQKLLANK